MSRQYNQLERAAYLLGYRVSETGQLFNPRGRKLSANVSGTGYFRFRITKHGGQILVHRLLGYQKYGERIYDPNLCMRHLDGNPLNNTWSNVVIGTDSENMMDKPPHIRILGALASAKVNTKHNHAKVIELHKSGLSYKRIMAELGISSLGTISFIIRKSMEAKAA